MLMVVVLVAAGAWLIHGTVLGIIAHQPAAERLHRGGLPAGGADLFLAGVHSGAVGQLDRTFRAP